MLSRAEIERRLVALDDLARPCRLCPRTCRVDRRGEERGFCGVGEDVVVSSFGPHFGEERELVGRGGSGTIFLAGCSLGCLFCQNHEISHGRQGTATSPERLALLMLHLQELGCHNVNLVTPTHSVPGLVRALALAWEQGLTLPVVYNCGGYESVAVLRLLEGIVDIYMPDAKWGCAEPARRYAAAPAYPRVVQAALREMHRQVGVLVTNAAGIACRGLLVRHLVLPGGLEDTREVLRFCAGELSVDTYVNIMDQYRPCYKAWGLPPLDRRPTRAELARARELARSFGLHRGFFG